MTKGRTTRAAAVNEALNLAIDVGLEGITLGTLAERLHLSKSGLFAHFASKEVLQLAVVDEAIEQFARRVILPAMGEPDGRSRLEALFRGWLGWIHGDEVQHGCLFVAMITEYDDRPGPIRDRLVQSQAEWRALLGAMVTQAKAERQFASDVDPAQVTFELSGIAMAFHQACKLFRDPAAHTRAMAAFDRLVPPTR